MTEDDTFIINSLSERGMPVDKDSLALVKKIAVYGKTGIKDREVMRLCADLVNLAGKTTKHVSKNLMSQYSAIVKSATGITGNTLGAAGAVLGVAATIFTLVSELQDRAETNEIAQRWLQDLDTTSGLAPESIRIVAAVKQIIERGFDQHELRSIDADSSVTMDFLSDKIIPLVQNLEDMDQQTVSNHHKRLIDRMDINRKNMHIHFQKASAGMTDDMDRRGDYQVDTNHLVRYSKACTLDAFLSFYELLLSERLGNSMMQQNCEAFVSHNQRAMSTTAELLQPYTDRRIELIRTRQYWE